MLSDEFIDMMKNDAELQQLRRQVYANTGQLKDISFCSGASYTYDEWKELTEEARKQLITDSGKGAETNGR